MEIYVSSNFDQEVRGDLDGDWFLNANWKEDGYPMGGVSTGIGFTISWQRGATDRYGRNGAFLIEVLESCLARLQFYKNTSLYSSEDSRAEQHLKFAIAHLVEKRENRFIQQLADRQARGSDEQQ